MSKERRIFERVDIEVSARVFNNSGEIVLGEGKIVDLSSGGAKLFTLISLKVGEIVQLEFYAHKPGEVEKDKLALTCEVETVWKAGKEGDINIFGVKFVNLSGIAKDVLSKLVDSKKQ